MKMRPIDILNNLKNWDSETLGPYKMQDHERDTLIEILKQYISYDNKESQTWVKIND